MASLVGLAKLRSLGLQWARVDDDGMKEIAKLTELRALSISFNSLLTRTGFALLKRLTKLEALYVQHTDIGDADIAGLGSLSKLRILNLASTKATKSAIEALDRAQPLWTHRRGSRARDGVWPP